MACYEAWNSPLAGRKRGEMTNAMVLTNRHLQKPENLDPKQGDSVAILPLFIQSP
jgi:hypothetical protein